VTRERAKELLPVIQAWAEGKEIEVSGPGIPNEWLPLPEAHRCFETEDLIYRVKPTPRKWVLEFAPTGGFYLLNRDENPNFHGSKLIKVIEEIE
jgi:hypothetical protein